MLRFVLLVPGGMPLLRFNLRVLWAMACRGQIQVEHFAITAKQSFRRSCGLTSFSWCPWKLADICGIAHSSHTLGGSVGEGENACISTLVTFRTVICCMTHTNANKAAHCFFNIFISPKRTAEWHTWSCPLGIFDTSETYVSAKPDSSVFLFECEKGSVD